MVVSEEYWTSVQENQILTNIICTTSEKGQELSRLNVS